MVLKNENRYKEVILHSKKDELSTFFVSSLVYCIILYFTVFLSITSLGTFRTVKIGTQTSFRKPDSK